MHDIFYAFSYDSQMLFEFSSYSAFQNLLEAQFDANLKFQDYLKSEAVTEDDLRKQCYGRDKDGLCYWLIQVISSFRNMIKLF